MRQFMPGGALRKCFELAGIVPLGVFVLVHVVAYAGALFDLRDFGVAAERSVVVWVLESLLVWAPLLFHTIYGLRLSVSPLEADLPERRRSLLLRLTGMFALFFILAHAAWLKLPLLSGVRAPEDIEQMLAAGLSSTVSGLPLAALLHLVGLGVVLFHFSVGLPRFVGKWGLGDVQVAQRVSAIGCGILFAVGSATVIELATGSAIPRFFGAGP